MTAARLFIAGVPKCGTTTLFDALGRHPDVFAPAIKEPHFHAYGGDRPAYTGPGDDHFNASVITDRRAYDALYQDAGGKLTLDASALTACVEGGLARARDDQPEAHCLLLVRDPRARAASAWMHLTRDGREDQPLAAALAAESDRLAAGFCPIWGYRTLGRYDPILEEFRRVFGPDGTVLDLATFTADPAGVLRALAARLDLHPSSAWLDEVIDARRANGGGLPRWPTLYRAVARPSRVKAGVQSVLPAQALDVLRRAKDKSLSPPAPGLMADVPGDLTGELRNWPDDALSPRPPWAVA